MSGEGSRIKRFRSDSSTQMPNVPHWGHVYTELKDNDPTDYLPLLVEFAEKYKQCTPVLEEWLVASEADKLKGICAHKAEEDNLEFDEGNFFLRVEGQTSSLLNESDKWVLFIRAQGGNESLIVNLLFQGKVLTQDLFTILSEDYFDDEKQVLSAHSSEEVPQYSAKAMFLCAAAEEILLSRHMGLVRFDSTPRLVKSEMESKLKRLKGMGYRVGYLINRKPWNHAQEDDLLFQLSRAPSTDKTSQLIDLLAWSQTSETNGLELLEVKVTVPPQNRNHWHSFLGQQVNNAGHSGNSRALFIYPTTLKDVMKIEGNFKQASLPLVEKDGTAPTNPAVTSDRVQPPLSFVRESSSLHDEKDLNKDKIFVTVCAFSPIAGKLDVDRDVENIKRALEATESRDSGSPSMCVKVDNSNPIELEELFQKHKPFFWYVGCHGTQLNGNYQSEDPTLSLTTHLYLSQGILTEDDIVHLCTRHSVSSPDGPLGNLAVVFLNCCYGARLGKRLYEEANIPHVIYWETSCLDEACTEICRYFFQDFTRMYDDSQERLSLYDCVNSAFIEARKRLRRVKINDEMFSELNRWDFGERNIELSRLTNHTVRMTTYYDKEEDRYHPRFFNEQREKACGKKMLCEPVGILSYLGKAQRIAPSEYLTISIHGTELKNPLKVSPSSKLTLPNVSRERAQIFSYAQYCYCYPPTEELQKEIMQVLEKNGGEQQTYFLQQWFLNGGFIYFSTNCSEQLADCEDNYQLNVYTAKQVTNATVKGR